MKRELLETAMRWAVITMAGADSSMNKEYTSLTPVEVRFTIAILASLWILMPLLNELYWEYKKTKAFWKKKED